MGFADVLTIDHAAAVLGVTPETLFQRLDRGGLPEAVHYQGNWCVPSAALTAIAEREGWRIDLDVEPPSPRTEPAPSTGLGLGGTDRPAERRTSGPTQAVIEPLREQVPASMIDGQDNETMAAHAAVVLAKTQAAAARAEAADLTRRLRRLVAELEDERTQRSAVEAQLAAASRAQAILERDRAVAEARADELRKQVEQERLERSMLAERIGTLEADREEAITSMDRWSRRRYERRQQLSTGNRPPKWIQNLTDGQK